MSSRKLKINFSIGERVLCYEPDPTKAKVLYDSKILQVNITQDSDGRKVPEYLVHFLGWSKNWRRIVNEDFILPDTDENRCLQDKLAAGAGVILKRKYRGSFPFKPAEKRKPEKVEVQEKKETDVLSSTNNNISTIESTSGMDAASSDDEETEKAVEIHIPEPLEAILYKDSEYIMEKRKLIQLPCQENVLSILENYVKHSAAKILCPQKGMKSVHKKNFNDIESEINFYKEIADGLRIYFDFILPHLLLYRQEVPQFVTLKASFDLKEEPKEEYKSVEENMKRETPDKYSLRQRKCRNSSQKCSSPNENGGTEMLKLEDSLSMSPSKITPPKSKKQKIMGIRQSLRSAHRVQSPANNETQNNSETSELSMSNNSISNHHEPLSPSQNSPTNQVSITILNSSTPYLLSKNLQRTLCSNSGETVNYEPSVLLNKPTISLEPCVLISRMENSPKLSSVNSSLLKDILKWKIIPEKELTKEEKSMPSSLYGAHHLLRLFVKLPELLSKVHLPNRKREQLISALEDFLEYLSQKRNDIFSFDSYVHAEEWKS